MPTQTIPLNETETITYNNQNVTELYLGSQKIWPAAQPYIYFECPEYGSFSLRTYQQNQIWDGTVEYSTNGTTWNTWTGSYIHASPSYKKIFLRGTNNTYFNGTTASSSNNKRFVIESNGYPVYTYGNIETLLDYQTVANGGHPVMANNCFRNVFRSCSTLSKAPELPATTLSNGCYSFMFHGCTGLTTAPVLPATSLVENCYNSMFYNCTGLTTAPVLPATSLAENCYRAMFNGCTGLTTAPVLPATTLATYCYAYMFSNCTGLTTAPVLPATTLAIDCYYFMFSNTGLTTAPVLPATTLAVYCYSCMFYNCTALTAIPSLPATTLADYCYTSMFLGCTNVKISDTQSGEYQTPYRIPTNGTGIDGTRCLESMFVNTGGTFTGDPVINTTYYTSNTVV